MSRGVPAALVAAGLVALVAAWPWLGAGYGVRLGLVLLTWVVLAQSWNLASGLSGYLSLGHVVFPGTGAYATALLVAHAAVPWPLACLAGGAAATALAGGTGWACARLPGPAFAVATLALAEAARAIVVAGERLTGGAQGLLLPPLASSVPVYYAMAGVAIGATVLAWTLLRSRLALRLLAIEADERAAATLGIDTVRVKTLSLALSAAGAGLAGGLAAVDQGFVEPAGAFSFLSTATMIAMVVVGGRGTLWGPVAGAVAVTVVRELLATRLVELHQPVFGLLVVAAVLAMPQGLVRALPALARARRGA